MYVTTFDSISHTVACAMMKKLDVDKEPSKLSKILWSITFIVLPMALIFVEAAVDNILTLAIIGAVPLSILWALVIISFFMTLRKGGLDRILLEQAKEEVITNIVDVDDTVTEDRLCIVEEVNENCDMTLNECAKESNCDKSYDSR